MKEEWIAESEQEEPMTCNECPEMNKEEREIHISQKATQQIQALCKEYKELEWMGGIIGTIPENEEEPIIIQEIKVFEQEVTGITVEYTDKGNEEMAKTQNLIGWIHSHNDMTVFFSNTDVETCKFNKISIVVNNKLEMKAVQTITLPCKRKTLMPCTPLIKLNNGNNTFIQEAKKQIKEITTQPNKSWWHSKDTQNQLTPIEKICGICGNEILGKYKEHDGYLFHKGCFKRSGHLLQYYYEPQYENVWGSYQSYY